MKYADGYQGLAYYLLFHAYIFYLAFLLFISRSQDKDQAFLGLQ